MAIYHALFFLMHILDSFQNFLSNDTNFTKYGQTLLVNWPFANGCPRPFLLKQGQIAGHSTVMDWPISLFFVKDHQISHFMSTCMQVMPRAPPPHGFFSRHSLN